MPRNGSGTYNRAVSDYVFDTVISETTVNTEMDDLADALSDSLAKDGQTTPTANLPMGTYRHTGVGNASARDQYLTVDQYQDGETNWVDGSGTADAITAAYSPAITALVDGMFLGVRATAANATTTPTFSPNGLTARTIVKSGGGALVAGDIAGDGHELLLRYDLSNTRWELLNPTNPSSADVSGPGSSTDNALPRFDGTGGKTLQGSSVVVDDSNNMSGVANITATGTPTLGGLAYPTSDGSNGQVLTTNGSGTLSFASSGGSADTTARALAILALMNDDLAAGLNAVAVAYDWSTNTLATATNASNDAANEAYTNALNDSETNASPVSTGGFGNAIFVDRSFSLENGGLVDKLGFASNTGASNYDLYILERIGTEDYTPRAKIANATHTGGGALEYFDLAADYRVPDTGDFYVGIDVKSNATQGATSASTFARATRSTGSLTVDTNYNSGWTEGTNKVIVCGAQYVTGNMTLVPSAVTLDTADPDDVSLWTIVDMLDGGDPEADVQCRFTLNDGSNWTTAAVADSSQSMPGGTDKYLLRFDGDLSLLSGSSFKYEITTLNSEGVSVEEPIAVPLY